MLTKRIMVRAIRVEQSGKQRVTPMRVTPKKLGEKIKKYFKKTPADEIVRRAEKLKPSSGNGN